MADKERFNPTESHKNPARKESRKVEKYKTYDDHIAWLEAAMESLKEDNETLNSELLNHKETLESILPLRRHLKRQIGYHLRKVDGLITNKLSRKTDFKPPNYNFEMQGSNAAEMITCAQSYDKANLESYKKSMSPNILLPIYQASKYIMLNSARNIKERTLGPSNE